MLCPYKRKRKPYCTELHLCMASFSYSCITFSAICSLERTSPVLFQPIRVWDVITAQCSQSDLILRWCKGKFTLLLSPNCVSCLSCHAVVSLLTRNAFLPSQLLPCMNMCWIPYRSNTVMLFVERNAVWMEDICIWMQVPTQMPLPTLCYFQNTFGCACKVLPK